MNQLPYSAYIHEGSKIKFAEEKLSYTVQAMSERYLICTKPFNACNTVLYCIVDLEKNERGPENLVFGAGAETKEHCYQMLIRLLDCQSELSYRKKMKLNIEWIQFGKDRRYVGK